jgi:hypothetical protein
MLRTGQRANGLRSPGLTPSMTAGVASSGEHDPVHSLKLSAILSGLMSSSTAGVQRLQVLSAPMSSRFGTCPERQGPSQDSSSANAMPIRLSTVGVTARIPANVPSSTLRTRAVLPRSTPTRGSPQSSFFNPHSPERVTATRSVALVRSVGDHRPYRPAHTGNVPGTPRNSSCF